MTENKLIGDYIDRQIQIDDLSGFQQALYSDSGISVILAEPGAGKTSLLKSLGLRFGVRPIRASMFRHSGLTITGHTLIIDALDEVAKIDSSAVDQVLVKAAETGARRIIVASRSAQWDHARTVSASSFFNQKPNIVRLCPFNHNEQMQLFASYKPSEDFIRFKSGLRKLQLDVLLGNPQFLKIFADAYIKRNRMFESKLKIFSDAIEQLAGEKSDHISQVNSLPAKAVATRADRIYAKLLLAGCSGLSLSELNSDLENPFINVFLPETHLLDVVNTGLFKLADNTDQHEPVHRIIAEYGGARYLAKRVRDPSDLLSLNRVLALIAPNSIVRDELKGLVAWLAVEGDSITQERIIQLDPYAVFSNGDPARFDEKTKITLLKRLSDISKENPYFRGEDVWRTFSTHGFFTSQTIEIVSNLLKSSAETSQLKNLLLELIKGSPAVETLEDLLFEMIVDNTVNQETRWRAQEALNTAKEFRRFPEFELLLQERSTDSLYMAMRLVEQYGTKSFERNHFLALLNAIADAYFPEYRSLDLGIGANEFIKRLVRMFSKEETIWLLNKLSKEMKCICGVSCEYECTCKHGTSHIIGLLLDQHISHAGCVPQLRLIWSWIKELDFEKPPVAKTSEFTRVIRGNSDLRRNIQQLALGPLNDAESIFHMSVALRNGDVHPAITFCDGDREAVIEYAFNADNALLWSHFIEHHNPDMKHACEIPLRQRMRQQARSKPEFARQWALRERSRIAFLSEQRTRSYRRKRRMRRIGIRKHETKVLNQKNFDDNVIQIEDGRHWGWLKVFARGYLHKNELHYPLMTDRDIPVNALRNSLSIIKENVKTVSQIAIEGNFNYMNLVSHAACIAEFQVTGNLRSIDHRILRAVKARLNTSYEVYNGNAVAFENELNNVLFSSDDDAEQFLREVIEPQLLTQEIDYAHVYLLRDNDEYAHLRESLPLEWLENYPDMSLNPASTLFDIAAVYGDRSRLIDLVTKRCLKFVTSPTDIVDSEKCFPHRDFWMIRSFYFSSEVGALVVNWLKEKKERLLSIESISASLYHGSHAEWPDLTVSKIELILDIYIDMWPSVFLPSSYGSEDPPAQRAYRFLKELPWKYRVCDAHLVVPATARQITDSRFSDLKNTLKAVRADSVKKIALCDYIPPSIETVVDALDNFSIATLEDLRVFALEQLQEIQGWATGGETDGKSYFYESTTHVDENKATKRIVDKLNSKCNALGLTLTIEHQLADLKRCDFTIRGNFDGRSKLLVIEVKGQWHKQLYTAAAEQLHKRYSVHPNAENQGIFLVLWFGPEIPVAKVVKHEISSADEMRESILKNMPNDLIPLIDVFVLDLSK